MLQLGPRVAPAEETMAAVAREILAGHAFTAITAAEVRRTTDFLHKIIDLIRGCGFGVAIFSDRTPARTLANIFFEIGVAGVLGKPVQLIWSGQNPRSSAVPTDFIRTEWIRFVPGEEDQFRRDVGDAICQIEEGAAFYTKIGTVALEAPDPDLELAFERFKQAVLIADDADARQGIISVCDRLSEAVRLRRGDASDDMASHRSRLLQSVSEFIGLLPPRA
jgi:hypothetical protein